MLDNTPRTKSRSLYQCSKNFWSMTPQCKAGNSTLGGGNRPDRRGGNIGRDGLTGEYRLNAGKGLDGRGAKAGHSGNVGCDGNIAGNGLIAGNRLVTGNGRSGGN